MGDSGLRTWNYSWVLGARAGCWVTLGAAACSEQPVGDRALVAAAGSVRPQHAAVG